MNNMDEVKLEPILTRPRRQMSDSKQKKWNKSGRGKIEHPQLVKAALPRKKTSIVTVDTSKAKSNLDVVRSCLRELGWREYPFGRRDFPCDIYWNTATYQDSGDVCSGKVNKFPGMSELLNKINLTRALDLLTQLVPEEFDFYPETWFLPQQYFQFSATVKSRMEKDPKYSPTFIVKPDEGSQGEGIYLIKDPVDYVMNQRNHVVQEYLSKPLLIERMKFDLRVYVVLASIEPLEIYICKDGLARFCTVPYSKPTWKNLDEHYMHLTNYSLNKHSSTYVHTDSEDNGSKRSLTSVLRQLEDSGYNVTHLCTEIERLIIKTTLAIAPELKIHYRAAVPIGKAGPTCFQILGFDILLLEDLKPILLEVNSGPSLRIDYEQEVASGVYERVISAIDDEIKHPLVRDTLLLIAPKNKLKKRVKRDANSIETLESPIEDDQEIQKYPEESCLEQIFPAKYGPEYNWLRILERVSAIYQLCLGVKGTVSCKMGLTGFRAFTRRCKLTSQTELSTAEIDILYIELMKKWDMSPDKDRNLTQGLCYQGFMEGFLQIAHKKFPSSNKLDTVEQLIDYCESNLELHNYRLGSSILPRVPLTKAERRMDELKNIYGNVPSSLKRPEYFLDYQSFPVESLRNHRKHKSRTGRSNHGNSEKAKEGFSDSDDHEPH
ncbi:unnamed protein product [Owenia fusiformis]|uniref:Uncharacterized protein n=1 Tax=Owenia fusiformis TaxID=6347 RepID=A0A8J1U2S4_OWEFU|nr:unnamed protein product [Owenia fusiformis]